MRGLVVWLLAACAPAAPAGRLEEARFHSDALGADKAYLVWLPAGYDGSGRRYPVVYILHGYGGDETDGIRDAHLDEVARRLRLEAILVMPDGDDGFYVDWAEGGPRYGTYVARDLVAHIDGRFRTVAEREGRAVSGMSMGGYGALVLALSNPDLFGSASSHAGLTSLTRFPPPAGMEEHFERVFGKDRAGWRARDPVELAAAAGDRVALYLDCGADDQLGFADRARHLHEVLEARGIAHAFTIVPGAGHDAEFWRSRVDDSLRFHVERFR
jgi:S-formylglutathione hydrolase FrmB